MDASDKPQIICGDFNIGASKLDMYQYNPLTNGFRIKKLKYFEEFLEKGYVDSYKYINKILGNIHGGIRMIKIEKRMND